MALAASAPKMTAEEFFALPGELPHPQLIDGELVVSTPTAGHQRLVAELIGLFHVHRQSHPGCGELGIEIDTVLDEVNVFALGLTTADTLATPLIEGWTIDLGELFIR